jgi:hypothetical protein
MIAEVVVAAVVHVRPNTIRSEERTQVLTCSPRYASRSNLFAAKRSEREEPSRARDCGVKMVAPLG